MNHLSKDAVNRVIVGEDAQGQRLDNYLHKVLVLSQKHGLTPPGPGDVWQRVLRAGRMAAGQ